MNSKKEDSIIFKALQNIKLRDMKTSEEIDEENNSILQQIIARFDYYENNDCQSLIDFAQKKQLTIVEDTSEFTSGDPLYYIDLNKFYFLKFRYLGHFISITDDMKIKTVMNTKRKYYMTTNTENKLFFRIIKNEDRLKMKLYEILQ